MNPKLENTITSYIRGNPHGWCSISKALRMAELVFTEKPKLVVEIGVFGGRSLIPQALALQELNAGGKAVGIDAWSTAAALEALDPGNFTDKQHIDWWSRVPMESIFAAAKNGLDRYKLHDFCALVRDRAENQAKNYSGIDILHIDGQHTVEVSCRDVRLWLPQVRPGGHIWFDDSDWYEVQEAQAKLSEACDVVDEYNERAQPGGCCVKLFKKR
jgi:predicted O-methyltransferase YrrM